MTVPSNPVAASPAKSDAAIAQVGEFFDRYNRQDVPAMIELFEPEATIEYVPFALSGPVEEIGPGSWGVLIDSFPDLHNTVNSVHAAADGRTVFVDVNIGGTQTKEAFGVASKGNAYDVRHFFVFALNSEGSIEHVTSFWDNADWYRQLGKTELD